MKLNHAEDGFQSVDDFSSNLNKDSTDGDAEFLGNVEEHAIGNLLPDDEDELLAGIIDSYDRSGFPNQVDDLEEYDRSHFMLTAKKWMIRARFLTRSYM